MRKHKACQPLSPFDTPLIFSWYRLDTPMIVTHHFQQHIHEFKCVWRIEDTIYAFDAVFVQHIFTVYQLETPMIVTHHIQQHIQIKMRMKIHFMFFMPFLGSKYLRYTNFKLHSKWTKALYRTYIQTNIINDATLELLRFTTKTVWNSLRLIKYTIPFRDIWFVKTCPLSRGLIITIIKGAQSWTKVFVNPPFFWKDLEGLTIF